MLFEAFDKQLSSLGQFRSEDLNNARDYVQDNLIEEDTVFPVLIVNLVNGSKIYVDID